MMCKDPFDFEYAEILQAIEEDKKISGQFAE